MKRNGQVVEFDGEKIVNAICKAMRETVEGVNYDIARKVASDIEKEIDEITDEEFSVEQIQDMVEEKLMASDRKKVAKRYIIYREEQAKKRNDPWEFNELQRNIWANKYRRANETFDEWITRVSGGKYEVEKLIRQRKFLFGGRILAHRGVPEKVTYSNCYVLSAPEDNIESIFNTAGKLARTFSYGGGVGIDISKLRPRGAKVNNSAKNTTGAVSFMDLYSLTTELIGQNGRRGALMLSMDINHPDIEEFIDVKTNPEKVTKANISIKITDEFMEKVQNNEEYTLSFELGDEKIEKVVNARDLFMKLAQNNWDWAEPGILFWDEIEQYNLLDHDPDFKYAGVNPCAEEPLPEGGSCLLGSLNLSEFVLAPFTDKAMFDMPKFKEAVRVAVRALNDVLEEGLPMHPLEEQRKSVSEYRQIGLGVMGISDMLIKLSKRYGSEEGLQMSEAIGYELVNTALQESAMLAKEYGTFEKYDWEKVQESNFFRSVAGVDTYDLVKEHGLRNSQILTIAPTGSISTMLGVSGGIEPMFDTHYMRKTESLHNEDVYYKVHTPIVEEYMKATGIGSVDELPNYFETSHTVPYPWRIRMQSVWQQYIDASISSTINLPNDATVEQVFDCYMLAWQWNCKGLTVYRDGCKRSGILITEKKEEVEPQVENAITVEEEIFKCPECGNEGIVPSGGCVICFGCGFSPCS
jgi:ribonucleoside-diphosphate reductase alpha chain